MVRLRGILILAVLLSSLGPLRAAGSDEDRAYDAAAKAFQTGFWDYAEKSFGEFVQKFPQSSRVPPAILFQAEARYELKRYAGAISLLSARLNQAGIWADEYLFWMAQSQLQSGNDESAAAAFGRLLNAFPGSPRRPEAIVGEATAFARQREWGRVSELLENRSGPFQVEAAAHPGNPFVALGWLLLARAQLEQTNFPAAAATLDVLDKLALPPELRWRRDYLRCRWLSAQNRPEDALAATTNLLALAETLAHGPTPTHAAPPQAAAREFYVTIAPAQLLAESWSLRAGLLERLGRPDDAIAAYQNNVTNAPVAQQRTALLKIAELSLELRKTDQAVATLEDFWKQHPRSGAADMALLALGELQLKTAVAQTNAPAGEGAPGAATNRLAQALGWFDTLLHTFPQSPLAGKALLDKGWCLWSQTNYAQAETAFRLAAARLPESEDQAVARFKWADAQFMEGNYPDALTNYEFIVSHYAGLPAVTNRLFELALYQQVRTALAITNLSAASGALDKILRWYPNGFAGTNCLLYVGQGFASQHHPDAARGLFREFEARYPDSPLLPHVLLAVARTYEQQQAPDWLTAARQYAAWSRRFTNNAALPRAEFHRAWDYSMAGEATNALALFTNFVARFPSNHLAQQAQWWIGDYYFGQGDYPAAEYNYQLVFKNSHWPPSKLTYQAQMMAGRAAAARLSYRDAIGYFSGLTANTNCPPDIAAQALFAYGDAEMNLDSGETNRQADLTAAINIFSQIPATNDLAPLAWGRTADCYLQLAASDPARYADASKFYRQVIQSPRAPVSARSQAAVGLGIVAERLADAQTGAAQHTLLEQALGDYLDVFFQRNLRDGEQPDPFWVRKAGLDAARLAENLGQWKSAVQVYRDLEKWLPQMRPALENKIAQAEAGASAGNQ